MKVCTDSCLFGAWLPLNGNAKRVLDIGTGTGLLALMVAQRSNASVDAVELQPEAAVEALANIRDSPWHDRIRIHQGNILDAGLSVYRNRYDAIVCNPPFYANHLRSDNAADVTARHDVELPLNMLLAVVDVLLSENGSAFLLLPYEPYKNVDAVASEALKLAHAVAVKNKTGQQPIRWMLALNRNAPETRRDEIVIYNDDKSYTDRFVKLLKPYYLYL